LWLEKIMLKTYKEMHEEDCLLNGNIGWLRNEWWNMTIHEILCRL
jgi:hypothetical protein